MEQSVNANNAMALRKQLISGSARRKAIFYFDGFFRVSTSPQMTQIWEDTRPGSLMGVYDASVTVAELGEDMRSMMAEHGIVRPIITCDTRYAKR